jgi:hypothetical protein
MISAGGGNVEEGASREELDLPPDILSQMRLASRGQKVDRGFEWVQALKENKPLEFTRELARQERDYRAEQQSKLSTAAPAPAATEEDDEEPIIGLAEQWLRDYDQMKRQ